MAGLALFCDEVLKLRANTGPENLAVWVPIVVGLLCGLLLWVDCFRLTLSISALRVELSRAKLFADWWATQSCQQCGTAAEAAELSGPSRSDPS